MSSPELAESVIRFGEFAAHLETGELCRNGTKVKLQGQPFEILALLLKRPGRIVTREELRQHLWPSDTFVDFEHGLNAAVNRLRETLGDSAEQPQFIETVPRRGYRFIAQLSGPTTSLPLPPNAGVDSAAAATEGTKASPALGKPHPSSSSLLYLYIAGAILVSATLLSYFWTRRSQPPRLTGYVQVTGDSEGKTSSYLDELLSPLVSDGSRLYFMEGPLGGKKLTQVSSGGGETASFPAPFPVRRVLGISPNRRELLVLSSDQPLPTEHAVMALPLPAGSPHRVGDLFAHDASWSPDGSRIVYANGHDLYLAKGDGSEPRKLATAPGTAWWPRWSPDGSLLRFTVLNETGVQNLWEIANDGSQLHRLFSANTEPLQQCCGSWTADGRYFVFASSGDPNSQLWGIREERGFLKKPRGPFQLTKGPMTMFAPLPVDGAGVFAVAVQPRGQLVRYDMKSAHFLPLLSGISAQGVDFSKDGEWVTYVTFPQKTLWRSKADGSERLQLTLPPMQVDLPRWSPDGKRIAFLGRPAIGKPLKIYLISPDGGSPTQAIPSEPTEGEPSWSPDGKSLAFAPLFWVDGRSGIRIFDVRTRRLTPVSGSGGLFSARWSPDGRYIAALTADVSQTLVLLDLKTQKRSELCRSAAYPNWSRDGNYIYFDGPYSNEPALFRVRISDRKIEKLATLDPHVLTWAIVGKWTGLAHDDSPLVLRDTSVEEIYALDWEAR